MSEILPYRTWNTVLAIKIAVTAQEIVVAPLRSNATGKEMPPDNRHLPALVVDASQAFDKRHQLDILTRRSDGTNFGGKSAPCCMILGTLPEIGGKVISDICWARHERPLRKAVLRVRVSDEGLSPSHSSSGIG